MSSDKKETNVSLKTNPCLVFLLDFWVKKCYTLDIKIREVKKMRYTDWLEEDDIAIDKMIRAHEKQMGRKQEQKKPVFTVKSVRE